MWVISVTRQGLGHAFLRYFFLKKPDLPPPAETPRISANSFSNSSSFFRPFLEIGPSACSKDPLVLSPAATESLRRQSLLIRHFARHAEFPKSFCQSRCRLRSLHPKAKTNNPLPPEQKDYSLHAQNAHHQPRELRRKDRPEGRSSNRLRPHWRLASECRYQRPREWSCGFFDAVSYALCLYRLCSDL